MKVCKKCNIEKELECFSKHRSVCKPCRSKINSERISERYRNDEKFREQQKAYKNSNPEKVKTWKEKDYLKNKAAYKARAKLWNQTNSAVVRQIKRRYKSKRKLWELTGNFSQEEWDALLTRYGNKCLACGRSDVILTQDHVIPLSKGGLNIIDNIQPLCGPCNSSKGTKIIDYRSII